MIFFLLGLYFGINKSDIQQLLTKNNSSLDSLITKKDSIQAKEFKSQIDTVALEVAKVDLKLYFEISQLKEDELNVSEYKEKIRVYGYVYRSFLEQAFPGGYRTFGVRDNQVVDPGRLRNSKINFDVEGEIRIIGNTAHPNILIKNIEVSENGKMIWDDNLVKSRIENYDLGAIYDVGAFPFTGWSIYLIILDDNPDNPVYVLGLGRNYRGKQETLNYQTKTPFQFEVVNKKTFGAESVVLDGKKFVNCTFDRSVLIVKGDKPIGLSYCTFVSPNISFEGGAGGAIDFINKISKDPSLKPLFDQIIRDIMK